MIIFRQMNTWNLHNCMAVPIVHSYMICTQIVEPCAPSRARGGRYHSVVADEWLSTGLVWPSSGRAVNLGVFLQLNLQRTAVN
jgi:hypothetical protein